MSEHHRTYAWALAAKACKERDAWRCRWCGGAGMLEAHHQLQVRHGGSDSNWIT